MDVVTSRHTIARTFAGACCVWVLCGAAVAEGHCGSTLGPAVKREELVAQPDEAYTFVVRGTPQARHAAVKRALSDDSGAAVTQLEAFDSVALTLRVRDAVSVCSHAGVDQIWYLHPFLAPSYVKVLLGLQYAFRSLEGPSVVNMSIGPSPENFPLKGDVLEPMHQATRKLAEKGLIPVVAVGNLGRESGPNLVNPWCRAEWVVCVGAASMDGRTLWPMSSRGVPEDRLTWPTVVAHGVDVVGPWPTALQKSDKRREDDEGNAYFMASVPADRRNEFTLMSGSSQATAQVSRAATQIIFFVRSLAEQQNKGVGDRLFALSIPRERFEYSTRVGPRFAGTVMGGDEQVVEVEYRLVEPWRLVKQLLIDTAVPMKAYEAHEVGAGFVSPRHVEEQFGAFGVATRQFLPVKVE